MSVPTIEELQKLDDRELILKCLHDDRVNSACMNNEFWRQRLNNKQTSVYINEIQKITGDKYYGDFEMEEIEGRGRHAYLQYLIHKDYIDLRSDIQKKFFTEDIRSLLADMDKCYKLITLNSKKKFGQELPFLRQLRSLLEKGGKYVDFYTMIKQCNIVMTTRISGR